MQQDDHALVVEDVFAEVLAFVLVDGEVGMDTIRSQSELRQVGKASHQRVLRAHRRLGLAADGVHELREEALDRNVLRENTGQRVSQLAGLQPFTKGFGPRKNVSGAFGRQKRVLWHTGQR